MAFPDGVELREILLCDHNIVQVLVLYSQNSCITT